MSVDFSAKTQRREAFDAAGIPLMPIQFPLRLRAFASLR
jgi:hypothetical protein